MWLILNWCIWYKIVCIWIPDFPLEPDTSLNLINTWRLPRHQQKVWREHPLSRTFMMGTIHSTSFHYPTQSTQITLRKTHWLLVQFLTLNKCSEKDQGCKLKEWSRRLPLLTCPKLLVCTQHENGRIWMINYQDIWRVLKRLCKTTPTPHMNLLHQHIGWTTQTQTLMWELRFLHEQSSKRNHRSLGSDEFIWNVRRVQSVYRSWVWPIFSAIV